MLPSLRHYLSLTTLIPAIVVVAIALGVGIYVRNALSELGGDWSTQIIEQQVQSNRVFTQIGTILRRLDKIKAEPSLIELQEVQFDLDEMLKDLSKNLKTANNPALYDVVLEMRTELLPDLRALDELISNIVRHTTTSRSSTLIGFSEAYHRGQIVFEKSKLITKHAAEAALKYQKDKSKTLIEFSDKIMTFLGIFTVGAVFVFIALVIRTRSRSQVVEAQRKLAASLEGISESFVLFDQVDRLILYNSKYVDMHKGIEDQIEAGTTYEKLLRAAVNANVFQIPADHDQESFIQQRLDFHRKARGHYEQHLTDGRWVKISVHRTADGGVVLVQTDITELKHRESELSRQALIFANMSDAVIITDLDGKIVDWSPSAEKATGYEREEMSGKFHHELYLDVDPLRLSQSIAVQLKRSQRWDGELQFKCKDQHVAYWETAIVPMQNADNEDIGMIAVCRDITMRKEAEKRIQHMATHDFLTNMPNRNLFMDRLNQSLANAKRRHEKVAVLLLDLDHFKDINDSHGHSSGDSLLQEISDRLQSLVRDSDTVARLGGDEFAVVQCGNMDTFSPGGLARRVKEAMDKPFDIDSHHMTISTSIGIAVYPDDAIDAESLLKNADVALYLAKDDGRNTHQFFVPEMNQEREVRKELLTDLRTAIDTNAFTLHYQPQIDARSGTLIGAEILIRWQHEERGFIPPSVFIPIAESSGLILSLGDWVLRTTCKQVKQWQEQGLGDMRYAVNLSALQFKHHDLVQQVIDTLDDYSVSPRNIEFEITESTVMQNVSAAINKMDQLSQLGIHFSIDDFGTGYSSLSHLKRFPVHKVKIDGTFVGEIGENEEDAAIVDAVINLGHSMNLTVVAEGVETKNQLTYLKRQGCDAIQGYYYSKPVPADKFMKFLLAHDKGEPIEPDDV